MKTSLTIILILAALFVLGFLGGRLILVDCEIPTEIEIKLQEIELKTEELRQDYCFNICEVLKYGFSEEVFNTYQNCLDNCLPEKKQ